MTRRREETDMQDGIRQAAEALGYLTYHTYDSRRCTPGFPDLWILGFGKLIVPELKAGKNKTTEAQDRWISELRAAGVDARVYHADQWRKRDLVYELVRIKREYIRENNSRTIIR